MYQENFVHQLLFLTNTLTYAPETYVTNKSENLFPKLLYRV